MKKTAALTLSIIMLTALLTGGCARNNSDVPVSVSGIYFDTVVNITLYDYTGSSDTLLNGCLDMCEYFESLFSATVEGSDVWRINHAAELTDTADDSGVPIAAVSDDGSITVAVHPETAELIQTALDYCALSDGALDLTVGTLSNLWDIKGNSASDDPILPDPALIDDALSHINYQNVSMISVQNDINTDNASSAYMTDCVVISDPAINITLGFIAKGYASDKLCEYLSQNGVSSALINLGGNIATLGTKPDGTRFLIGIQEPFAAQGDAVTSVSVSDYSVVSSGVYERYFKKDGHIYHHIFDPKKGYPTDNGVLGVSVISRSSTDADALSTLCMVLGPDDGCALIESVDDTEVLYIMDDMSMRASSGWSSFTP